VRFFLIAASLLCGACAAGGAPPNQPFADIPVPSDWRVQTRESVLIQSPNFFGTMVAIFCTTPD
jgi:hypothetical protein